MNITNIPDVLIHLILEYYGRIKFDKGKYTNIISKKDERYNIVNEIILKKIQIIKSIEISGSSFYFYFEFDNCNNLGLCYDYYFTRNTIFEICLYNRNNWQQIRCFY